MKTTKSRTRFWFSVRPDTETYIELANLPKDAATLRKYKAAANTLGLKHGSEPVRGKLYNLCVFDRGTTSIHRQVDSKRITAIIAENEGLPEAHPYVTEIKADLLENLYTLKNYEIF